MARRLRVVLAHDWLTGMRGGERVLERLCGLFPDAPIYTLLHRRGSLSPLLESRRIVTSPLDLFPGAAQGYRRLLPLMPAAVRALRVEPCDLVLSTSHCAIKAIVPPPGARHLSYIFTPMRYVWDQAEAYFGRGQAALPTRLAAAIGAPWLRRWDARTARRVDRFVAISHCVADRVRRAYGRDAGLVYPPVELARFAPTPPPGPAGYYLMVTAFAPYKRVEVALEAFGRLGRRLKVVGDGQAVSRLRPLFRGPVEWLGPRSDAEVTRLYEGCRAFVLPGEEDFGITPLEAQASGRPVIALARGGATETVVPFGNAAGDPPTGILYPGGPSPEARDVDRLSQAIVEFEAHEASFRPEVCRRQAERFSPEAFDRGLLAEVDHLVGGLDRV